MIGSSDRLQLHARITSPATSEALDFLLQEMDKFGVFEFVPNTRGQKKAVMFRVGRSSPFAVIANNTWLLFYFRRPGLNSGIFEFAELCELFQGFEVSRRSDPEKTEGKLYLRTKADVSEVIDFIGLRQSRIRAMRA